MSVDGYDLVSRKAVRHQLQRLRNARVLRTRDESWPTSLTMHPDDWDSLRIERADDVVDAQLVTLEPPTFMDVPVISDPQLPRGSFVVSWPEDPPPIPAAYQ